MASRRLRIKPVANVPIRRGRAAENVEKVEDKTEQSTVHKPEEELPSAVNNSSSERPDDQNTEQSSQANGTLQDSIPSVHDKASEDDSTKTNSQVGVAKPSLLARKRVRPAVNIVALSRVSKTQNDNTAKIVLEQVPSAHPTPSENHQSEIQKSECPADNHHSETNTVSDMVVDAEDEINPNVEKTSRTSFRHSLNGSAVSNTTRIQGMDNLVGKEQKPARRHLKPAVNIAALSRSSRQQKSNNLTADREAKKMRFSISGITELSTKVATNFKDEKEPMSTSEDLPSDAELPAETASISRENSSVHSKHINSWPKHRFAKPVPQIKEAHVQRISSAKDGASNCESEGDSSKKSLLQQPESGIPGSASTGESDDDRSLSLASTISPPPRLRRHPELVSISSAGESRKNKGSTSESDDDASQRTLGSASTITPPCRRLSEVVREDKEEKHGKKCTKPRVLSTSAVRFRKARMEFYSKFNGTTTIDRSRLTMMDLIFYNPVTNPMKSSEKKLSESSEMQPSAEVVPPITEQTEESLAEEQADDPEAEEEDVAMPVPQVKVGPDGQIVLDERSLVIETTGAKKSRENLANSAVIVDTGTSGNGFYSRKFTKVKEWSKQETLKFYRALNIIGTDFLVMQSIFPKRSRRDLKMKFKREERINRLLVEKALRNPLDFDLTEMEKELAKEEEEEERRKKKKEQWHVDQEKIRKEKKKKTLHKNRSFLSRCMADEDSGQVNKRRSKKKKKASNIHKKEPMSSESDEENEVDSHNPEVQSEESTENDAIGNTLVEAENSLTKEGKNMQENEDNQHSEDSEDDEEIKKELQFLTRPPRPTRSGRMPQPKHHLSGATPTPKPIPKHCNPVVPLKDLSNIEPGSLVVIATQSPTNPGHQVYKVFMVAPPSQTGNAPAIAPVTLSPKVMQSGSEPDKESNIQLYNSETLSFASTQPVYRTSSQNVSNSPKVSCSTNNMELNSPSCSMNLQMQTPSLENITHKPCLPNQQPHSSNVLSQRLISSPQPPSTIIPISQSSFISNTQQCTTFVTDVQPNNTEVLSTDTHFVPITKPEHQSLHITDVNSQNMSIATSEESPTQVAQSDSTFVPVSCPQGLLPSSHQAEISVSPKPENSCVIVPQFVPPVVHMEHTASSDAGKQSNGSPVKDSESQNSLSMSTTSDDSPQSMLSSSNSVIKSPQICNTSAENTEAENIPRLVPQKNSVEGFGLQNNFSVELGSPAIILKSEEPSSIYSSGGKS